MQRDELAAWLRLALTPGVGNGAARRLLAAFGLPQQVFMAGRTALEKNFTLREDGESDVLNWVEAVPKASDSNFEKIRIGLAGKELRVMALHDNFGQVTRIYFSKHERNPKLPASLFTFTPPPGADVAGE